MAVDQQSAPTGDGAVGARRHTHGEDNPWAVYLEDHPPRQASRWFRAARRTARRILATLGPATYPYGPGPWEMHHGGSLWVLTGDGWRVFRARAAVEWSVQFCADPAKVERLRTDAVALLAGFPATVPALRELGYRHVDEVLGTPVTDAAGVERWTDGLFNSCLPLSPADHQGLLPRAAGEHHYPWPVKAADFVRYDDFQLWVVLPGSSAFAAVTPVAPRGSGDGRVRLLFAPDGTPAGDAVTEGQVARRQLVLPADHPVAVRAFALQSLPTSRPAGS